MKKRVMVLLGALVVCLVVGLSSYSLYKKQKDNSDEIETVNGVVIKKENNEVVLKLENENNTIKVKGENYNVNDILTVTVNQKNKEVKEVSRIYQAKDWNVSYPTEVDIKKFKEVYESKLVETYKNQISAIDVLANRKVEVFILPVKNEGSYLQDYSPREYAYHYLHITDISLWPIKFNENNIGTIKMSLPENTKLMYLAKESLVKNNTFEEVDYTNLNNTITFNVEKVEAPEIYYGQVLIDNDNIVDVIICIGDSY